MLDENKIYEIREFLKNDRVVCEAREMNSQAVTQIIYYTNVQVPAIHPLFKFPFMRDFPVIIDASNLEDAFGKYDESIKGFIEEYGKTMQEQSKPKIEIPSVAEQLLLTNE